jgi:hypothetical protein
VEALYEAERLRWLSDLGWDTSDAWPEVEGARTAGRLPGLLAVDDRGAICGWTYFLVDDRIAQVGSRSASRPKPHARSSTRWSPGPPGGPSA